MMLTKSKGDENTVGRSSSAVLYRKDRSLLLSAEPVSKYYGGEVRVRGAEANNRISYTLNAALLPDDSYSNSNKYHTFHRTP